MKTLLLTAFDGKTNSSRILINKIITPNKLILTNSFKRCEKQIIEALENLRPDIVLMFGQKPKTKHLHIETCARRGEEKLCTSMAYQDISANLKKNEIDHLFSDNAGNYLCNHAYFSGLDYIKSNMLGTKMIFIHVPSINNFSEIDKLQLWLQDYADHFKDN